MADVAVPKCGTHGCPFCAVYQSEEYCMAADDYVSDLRNSEDLSGFKHPKDSPWPERCPLWDDSITVSLLDVKNPGGP